MIHDWALLLRRTQPTEGHKPLNHNTSFSRTLFVAFVTFCKKLLPLRLWSCVRFCFYRNQPVSSGRRILRVQRLKFLCDLLFNFASVLFSKPNHARIFYLALKGFGVYANPP